MSNYKFSLYVTVFAGTISILNTILSISSKNIDSAIAWFTATMALGSCFMNQIHINRLKNQIHINRLKNQTKWMFKKEEKNENH